MVAWLPPTTAGCCCFLRLLGRTPPVTEGGWALVLLQLGSVVMVEAADC